MYRSNHACNLLYSLKQFTQDQLLTTFTITSPHCPKLYDCGFLFSSMCCMSEKNEINNDKILMNTKLTNNNADQTHSHTLRGDKENLRDL